jgi:glycosyltransferase involved in cell wall biosynthesis
MTAVRYAVVIPTVGRESLSACLAALAAGRGPRPERVVLVDDRPLDDCRPLGAALPPELAERVVVLDGCGRGPAAARNTGWRAVAEPWVAFLDDDVVPGPTWAEDLARDLAGAGPRTAAVQGRIEVPLPTGRRPTDNERGTAGLATACWITADMACRRAALAAVGGFDERFRRAFREDADLALRLLDQGWELTVGSRRTTHPVRPADRWASLCAQAGNADDVLMTRLHGRGWWARAQAPRGRFPGHLLTVGAALGAVAGVAARRPRAAGACAAVWAAATAEFTLARVLPGPRTRAEVATMAATSALIPFAATAHRVRGLLRHRRVRPWPAGPEAGEEPAPDAAPEFTRTG